MAERIYDHVDVAQLECHFKWFEKLNTASSGQCLSLLMNKQLHNDLMGDVDGVDVSEVDAVDDLRDETTEEEDRKTLDGHRLAILSWRFTLILRNTFGRNFAEAFRISNELSNLGEARNPSQSQVHIDTFSYVLLANQLNILKEWHFCADCTVDENEFVEITTRIESLKRIVDESNEAKAFINAMKSCLSRDMQDYQLRIDFAKKVGYK